MVQDHEQGASEVIDSLHNSLSSCFSGFQIFKLLYVTFFREEIWESSSYGKWFWIAVIYNDEGDNGSKENNTQHAFNTYFLKHVFTDF